MKIKNLEVSIETKTTEKILIDSFSYEFKTNNVYAIIGHNGSGKSSLLKEIFKKHLLGELKEKISYSSTENTKSFKKMTCYDYLKAVFKEVGYSETSGWYEGLEKNLVKYNISSEILRTRFDSLSGGEKKMVRLLALFESDDEYIMMDEPKASIDKNKVRIIDSIIADHNKNRCLIIATHNFETISSKGVKCLLIKDNTCVEVPSPKTKKEFLSLVAETEIARHSTSGGDIDENFNFDQSN